MKRLLAVAAAVALGGCGQDVAGNEVSVTVSRAMSSAAAMRVAEEHCSKYGRHARYMSGHDVVHSFDCVKP